VNHGIGQKSAPLMSARGKEVDWISLECTFQSTQALSHS
jgi:hypothetical protein